MKSGRGGFRENAGRKTGWPSGCGFDKTKIIRVPKEFAEQLLQIAHKLDAGEFLDLVTDSRQELNSNLLSEKELVTKSIDNGFINSVTNSNSESDLGSLLDKELVTESVERVIIDSVKNILARWREQSDEARITSPKSERWAKARQMLSELDPIVFGAALSPEKAKTGITAIDSSLLKNQSDSVTESITTNTELLEPVNPPLIELVTELKNFRSGDLVTNLNITNTERIELVTETELADIGIDVAQGHNQLNLLNEAEYQANNSKPEKEATSLTGVELAERFGVKVNSFRNRVTGKMASTFSEWSQKKDPQGIAWQYYPETKLFFPVAETVTNPEVEVVPGKLDRTPQS